MEIGLYIAELLGEQNEVSVVGLGTFFKERIAGTFDKQLKLYYPPSYRISFKENETSFSNLGHYISLKRGLSFSSSEELIKKYTDSIQDSLNNSDAVQINYLGSLYKEHESLVFKSSESFDKSDNFYGLKPVNELEERIILVPDEDIISIKPEQPANYEVHQIEEEIFEEATKSKFLPIILISIFTIIAAFLALFYFNSGFRELVQGLISPKNKINTTTAPSSVPIKVPSITLDSAKNELIDTLNNKEISISEKANSEVQSQTEVGPINEKTLPVNQKISYEIIVAAFSRKVDAETYMKELSVKGIYSKIVSDLPGTILKISIGTFTDEETANIELKRIQKEINKDAWIARVNR